MGRAVSFKEEFTFKQMLEELRDIIAKYPDRIPVIVERYARADLPQMEKKRYLVPKDMSFGQFIHVLSKRLDLASGKALCLCEEHTPSDSQFNGVHIRAARGRGWIPVLVLQQ